MTDLYQWVLPPRRCILDVNISHAMKPVRLNGVVLSCQPAQTSSADHAELAFAAATQKSLWFSTCMSSVSVLA